MIKSWTLEHFKSIYEEKTLEMAPLTIFCGANSAGKSTIIQSLLMVTQTLQSTVSSRSVVLNGHLCRLGTFDDVLSNGIQAETIKVGFEIRPVLTGDTRSLLLQHRSLFSSPASENADAISCNIVFGCKGDNAESEALQLQPRLEKSTFKIQFHVLTRNPDTGEVESKKRTDEVILKRSSKSLQERAAAYSLQNPEEISISSLQYEVEKPARVPQSKRFYRQRMHESRLAGATLFHFVPERFSIVYDEVTEASEFLLKVLEGDEERLYLANIEVMNNPSLQAIIDDALGGSQKLQDIIYGSIDQVVDKESINIPAPRRRSAKRNLDVLRSRFSRSTLLKIINSLETPQARESLVAAFTPHRETIKKIIKEKNETSFRLAFAQLSDEITVANEETRNFFGHGVKYLGPLRDEPKPVYPLAGAIDPKDVGLRGEYTAAVLDINRNVKVEYIPSRHFSSQSSNGVGQQTTHKEKVSLQDAVLDWLSYMGVVSKVKTADKGILGHSLQVSVGDSDSLHDLTHVGVGVSQVLPILVLSLLADPGSTLIFEQPELHLHPRVQTRLADFFVSMIALRKQCIIETHSEYLINRLRYRAAVSDDDQIPKDVVLYFAEKEGQRSHFRKISINRYGVIDEWPTGFFDESENLAAEILTAAMQKRRTETPIKRPRVVSRAPTK